MLRLRTLGDLGLSGPDGELLTGRRKELALLAYLGWRSPRAARREELTGLLWDEREEARARQSLRQAVLRLRRALGEGLVVEKSSIRLAEGVVELDTRALETDAAAGRPAAAVARWRGEFLAGAEDAGGTAFRAWVEAEREALRRRVAGAFEQLVAAAERTGELEQATTWAQRLAETFPLDESAQRRWLELLSSGGRAEEAVARHAAFVARVRRELELEPSPDFLRLATTLHAAATRARPAPPNPRSAALFTPDLVGRDGALAELEAAWRVVTEGGSATVVVEGEEGYGKTLLSEQFLYSLERRQDAPLVLRVRAREEEQGSAWTCARALLAPLAHTAALDEAPTRAVAAVSRLVPTLRDRYPSLPETAARGEGAVAADVARVLASVARVAPLIAFVDDLPYADAPSRDLILWLAHHPQPGVLLLVTAQPDTDARSGPIARLCRFPRVRRVKLGPLTAVELGALLDSMLALTPDDRGALAAQLHAETRGNPFYATEMVGALVDEGHLTPDERGVWRFGGAAAVQPASLPLPTGVREALGRRLDRLGEDARLVAAAGASLPEPFTRAGLQAAAMLPANRFQAALEELIVRRLIQPLDAAPDTLEFTHPLTRRVARERFGESSGSRPGAPAPAGRSRRRRMWRAAAVALGVLGAIAVLGESGGVLRSSRASDAVPVIAVGRLAAFGATDTADLSGSVATLLATNLARLPQLQVVSGVRMYELLGQLGGETGATGAWAVAARQAGATELLEGELHRTPDGLRLQLRRVDLRSGTVRAAYIVAGADPFEVVDRATAEIGSSLGLRAGPLRVADVTTSSVVAYRFYEEGVRSHLEGDYRGAVRLLEAALAEDSSFALAAHYALAGRMALHQPIPPADRERVLRLADRASEPERLRIRSAWGGGYPPVQLALAETLAIRYPTEPDGHLLLGSALIAAGDFMDALPHLERVVAMDSLGLRGTTASCRACDALRQTVAAYQLADSIPAAERVARSWTRQQPRSAVAWNALAELLEIQGRFDEAAEARRTAVRISPGHPYEPLFPALAHIRAGDFAAADRLLLDLARTGTFTVRSEALWFLTISLRNQGRLRDALAALQESASLDSANIYAQPRAQQQAQVLLELGQAREAARHFLAVARMPADDHPPAFQARYRSWNLLHSAVALHAAGDTAALPALADSIAYWGARSDRGRDARLHHHVRGLLLATRGDRAAAADHFSRAIHSRTLGHTRTNVELARLLLELERPREAVAILQSALRGSLEASNLYVTHTDVHELLGRAWEAAGRPDSALHHYQRVLAAWRAADPELAGRRAAVAARVAALKAGT
jgi:DNA-binding SARP family transcriptional activator/tetratricopeptide (TPR) repeat protein/TolB-like protein